MNRKQSRGVAPRMNNHMQEPVFTQVLQSNRIYLRSCDISGREYNLLAEHKFTACNIILSFVYFFGVFGVKR